jgi:hypothetical protein
VVIKSSDGLAGDGVYLLREMSGEHQKKLLEQVEDATTLAHLRTGFARPNFVAQPFVTSSTLPMAPGPHAPRAQIDIRPISYVGPTLVTPPILPWGRATTRFGNPRHNVSLGAMQLVVLTPCEEWLGGDAS